MEDDHGDDEQVMLRVDMLRMKNGGVAFTLMLGDEHLQGCPACLALANLRISATISEAIDRSLGETGPRYTEGHKGHVH